LLASNAPDREVLTVPDAKVDTKVYFVLPSLSSQDEAWHVAEELLEAATSGRHEAKHARAVSSRARRIGVELGLDEQELRTLALGALLHDVGKRDVPKAVLCKPGPLTPRELERVQEHPEKGARMAEAVGCLRAAARVIRHHHERYDGSGYPEGLAGRGIPLAARIVSVADAYDAMVRGRPYKGARPPTEAVREMLSGANGQFDPWVVAALGRVQSEGNGTPRLIEPQTSFEVLPSPSKALTALRC
jgi:putative nucleotidyltransferase with HDIG domain